MLWWKYRNGGSGSRLSLSEPSNPRRYTVGEYAVGERTAGGAVGAASFPIVNPSPSSADESEFPTPAPIHRTSPSVSTITGVPSADLRTKKSNPRAVPAARFLNIVGWS